MDATRRLVSHHRRARRQLQAGLARARRDPLMVVIQPTPCEIQIDLDGARALHTFSRQFRMLESHQLTRRWETTLAASRTKNHMHVTITLPHRRPLRERVLLAALLGSDLKREAFNFIRTVTRRRVPVAFFEARKQKK